MMLLTVIIFSSCALKPISSDYKFINSEIVDVEINKLGNGTILIYNGADVLHKIDNTGRLNILIDNEALGQIRPGEYVIIDIKNGIYEFSVRHIDLVNMRSKHNVEIDKTIKVIRIEPTLTSNKLTTTNEIPNKFENFEYMKNR